MKFTIKHAIAAILLIGSFAAPVLAGPFEDGYRRIWQGQLRNCATSSSPISRPRHGQSSDHTWRDVLPRSGRGAELRRGNEMVPAGG